MSRTSTASSSPRKPDSTGASVPERPEEIRRLLSGLGIRPSRALGQSFLLDPYVADAEAALVGVVPGRPVVEIGGGLGTLTAALLRRGIGPLTVVERDPRLARHLRATFRDRIHVIEGDALVVKLPEADAVVGNLPYSAATPILLRLFEARVPTVVALLQEEVAQRLATGPGSKAYGRLSIAARLYGEVELFLPVRPEAFYPVPLVRSRVVVHRARPGDLPVPSPRELETITRVLFSSRRKKLGNLLPRLEGGTAAATRLALSSDWPEDWATRRPEELAPEAYFALARERASHRPAAAARGAV